VLWERIESLLPSRAPRPVAEHRVILEGIAWRFRTGSPWRDVPEPLRLRSRGIAHTIPEPKDQKANRTRRGSRGGWPVGFDGDIYRHRNTVERCFSRLKQWRGLATRSDKHAHNYQGGLLLASLLLWGTA